MDGGADKDRTCDLLNAIQALYQLSYDPIRSERKFKNLAPFVKANPLCLRFFFTGGRGTRNPEAADTTAPEPKQ